VRTREAAENSTMECKCGWLVAGIEYYSIIIDAPCPRCGRKFSTFRTSKKFTKEKQNEPRCIPNKSNANNCL